MVAPECRPAVAAVRYTARVDVDPAIQPVDPLRLQHCPACGYRLDGLPPEGVCPECGRPYDNATVILHGWSRGTHANASTGTARTFVGFLALIVFQIFNTVLNPALRHSAAGLVAVGFCAVALVYALWRRWTADLPGLVQVHLCDAGCRQLDNPKRERQPPVAPWRELNDVLIGEESAGMWRIRIRRVGRWWAPQRVPVDAVVRLDREQGWTLRGRISAWREAAAAGAAAAQRST